jgi:hypothetical protein
LAIAVVLVLSLLWSVFAQTPGQRAERLSRLAYGSQVYLPLEFKGVGPTPQPTAYGGVLVLPPALRAEQPFQETGVAGRFFALIAGGALLLVGALSARQRSR